MTTLWFDRGVEHRTTGPKTLWNKKSPEMQAAIILAANTLGGDYWELVLPRFKEFYLRQARKLLLEGVQVAPQGGQGTQTRVAAQSAA